MTDPLERIRYDDPDAPALFSNPVDAADQAYERAVMNESRLSNDAVGLHALRDGASRTVRECDVFAGAAD
ncbi:hypothetical protein GTA09_21740 [Rhodococcus hoagii]|nr:hypothetical protein [Prescottella equi]